MIYLHSVSGEFAIHYFKILKDSYYCANKNFSEAPIMRICQMIDASNGKGILMDVPDVIL